MNNSVLLSHEKLDVYQKAVQLLALSASIYSNFPRGYGELTDQLKHASLSVPLNIVEASGRTGSGENARHFSIARGSALESGAIIDAAYTLKLLDAQKYTDAKRLIVAIVSTLSKLCTKK
jgi:four helix bundle protein